MVKYFYDKWINFETEKDVLETQKPEENKKVKGKIASTKMYLTRFEEYVDFRHISPF